MAGNRITWDIGLFDPDTHYVYRSDAPMDPNSLPTPIATLGQGISVYEDTNNIVEGNTYYYRVDAEKMGLYIPGYEIEYLASPTTMYLHDVFGDSSIIATYNFNNDLTDLGGNYNASLYNGTEQYDTGIFNTNSVKFDGNTDIDLGALPEYSTVSLWVLFDNTSSVNGIIGPYYSNGGITAWSGDILRGYAVNTTYIDVIDDTSTIQTGVFHHLVITHDGLVYKGYFNNIEKVSVSSTNKNSFGRLLGAGNSISRSRNLNGRIDQLRFFNRAITPTEVDILYQEGSGA